jgi:DNA invertase Pin-like site-specific DNA recombinase
MSARLLGNKFDKIAKERALKLLKRGVSVSEVAARFNVRYDTIKRIKYDKNNINIASNSKDEENGYQCI